MTKAKTKKAPPMPAAAIKAEIVSALEAYGYDFQVHDGDFEIHIWVPIGNDNRGRASHMGVDIYCEEGAAWCDGDWVYFRTDKMKFEYGFGMKYVRVMTEAIAKTFHKNIVTAISSV